MVVSASPGMFKSGAPRLGMADERLTQGTGRQGGDRQIVESEDRTTHVPAAGCTVTPHALARFDQPLAYAIPFVVVDAARADHRVSRRLTIVCLDLPPPRV
jgi:hypothetical protein